MDDYNAHGRMNL